MELRDNSKSAALFMLRGKTKLNEGEQNNLYERFHDVNSAKESVLKMSLERFKKVAASTLVFWSQLFQDILPRIFNKYDSDSDGNINFEQFVLLHDLVLKGAMQEKLKCMKILFFFPNLSLILFISVTGYLQRERGFDQSGHSLHSLCIPFHSQVKGRSETLYNRNVHFC